MTHLRPAERKADRRAGVSRPSHRLIPILLPLTYLSTRAPGGLAHGPGYLSVSPTAPALPPAPTYNVHEREQVLLHVLLPVELDHRVVHAQQDLDVVVAVGSMPSRPAPRATDTLLQDTQGTAEVTQAARQGPWKDRGHSLKWQPRLTRDIRTGQNPTWVQLGTSLAIILVKTHAVPTQSPFYRTN